MPQDGSFSQHCCPGKSGGSTEPDSCPSRRHRHPGDSQGQSVDFFILMVHFSTCCRKTRSRFLSCLLPTLLHLLPTNKSLYSTLTQHIISRYSLLYNHGLSHVLGSHLKAYFLKSNHFCPQILIMLSQQDRQESLQYSKEMESKLRGETPKTAHWGEDGDPSAPQSGVNLRG